MAKLKLQAIVSAPPQGGYTVIFQGLTANGRFDPAIPRIELPTRGYEHARRIERAFNSED